MKIQLQGDFFFEYMMMDIMWTQRKVALEIWTSWF